ncbi:hypothetical protein OSTOST_03792 [Ostertagia ostertagi]
MDTFFYTASVSGGGKSKGSEAVTRIQHWMAVVVFALLHSNSVCPVPACYFFKTVILVFPLRPQNMSALLLQNVIEPITQEVEGNNKKSHFGHNVENEIKRNMTSSQNKPRADPAERQGIAMKTAGEPVNRRNPHQSTWQPVCAVPFLPWYKSPETALIIS